MQTNSVIKWLTGAVVLAALLLVNLSIYQKEQQLRQGRVAILQLAPVDPRSLMQGDYMALRFALGNEVQRALWKQRDAAGEKPDDSSMPPLTGRVVVVLDKQDVARFVALDSGQTLAEGQLRLEYRLRHGSVQFATNAFFFQEGSGQQYEAARYGLFRVSESGQPYLTHMLDEKLETIGKTRNLTAGVKD